MNFREIFQYKYRYHCLVAVIFLIVTAITFNYGQTDSPKGDLKVQTFSVLNKIREEKKQEVFEYFKKTTVLADSIKNDRVMRQFFSLMKRGGADANLEYEIDKQYVETYGNFYDILFVDPKGYVFHSIKKEADYHQNLFDSDVVHKKLVNALKNPGKTKFAEFDYYRPSDEAAAFFPVSIERENRHLGWFILQCDINTVNTILTDHKGLGRTGEIYLVNKEKLMLSDSRFMEDSTILRQKIDTVAVKEAFAQKAGNNIIEDYRGVKVFSSYESFEVFGASWGIIAEIDENEIITEYYKKNTEYFKREFVKYLALQSPVSTVQAVPRNKQKKRVDINEFAKVGADSVLTTEGVASCTAVGIVYPQKFAYLAHISPTDEIYLDNSITKMILRDKYHNFTSELLSKIKFYEIYPYEMQKLNFYIVAPHSRSFGKALDSFLSNGVNLANIKFIYNPKARSANVVLSPVEDAAWVQWNEQAKSYIKKSSEVEDLGEVLKKIIRYDA